MKAKVLYVEDEVFLGKIVKESLESRDYLVEMVSDGSLVLQVFKKFQPQICILDIMLPKKNGFEIAEDIRRINTDLPIIFLTAKTQVEDVIKGFKTGGNDYIRKPFSVEELIVRIENLLQLNSETVFESDIVTIGEFTFDISKQVLIYRNIEKRLSYRESQLLQYLFKNKNKIIDRRELLNHIWGNDSFFNSRNLDVYVTKVRSMLKDDSSIEILTIKGIGYRFIC